MREPAPALLDRGSSCASSFCGSCGHCAGCGGHYEHLAAALDAVQLLREAARKGVTPGGHNVTIYVAEVLNELATILERAAPTPPVPPKLVGVTVTDLRQGQVSIFLDAAGRSSMENVMRAAVALYGPSWRTAGGPGAWRLLFVDGGRLATSITRDLMEGDRLYLSVPPGVDA